MIKFKFTLFYLIKFYLRAFDNCRKIGVYKMIPNTPGMEIRNALNVIWIHCVHPYKPKKSRYLHQFNQSLSAAFIRNYQQTIWYLIGEANEVDKVIINPFILIVCFICSCNQLNIHLPHKQTVHFWIFSSACASLENENESIIENDYFNEISPRNFSPTEVNK